MFASVVTLVGLGVAMWGSAILYFNRGSLWKETADGGDMMPSRPTEVDRQRQNARFGFLLVFIGFFAQAIGVILPLVIPK
jgi:hypothetical protein